MPADDRQGAGSASICGSYSFVMFGAQFTGELCVETFPTARGRAHGHKDILAGRRPRLVAIGDFLFQQCYKAGLLIGSVDVGASVATGQGALDRLPLVECPLAQGGLHGIERFTLGGPMGLLLPVLKLGLESGWQSAGDQRQVGGESQTEPGIDDIAAKRAKGEISRNPVTSGGEDISVIVNFRLQEPPRIVTLDAHHGVNGATNALLLGPTVVVAEKRDGGMGEFNEAGWFVVAGDRIII